MKEENVSIDVVRKRMRRKAERNERNERTNERTRTTRPKLAGECSFVPGTVILLNLHINQRILIILNPH